MSTPLDWRWIHALAARLRAIIRPARAERGLNDELSFHLAMQTHANQQAGMNEAEARRRARIAVGGIEPTKEGSRDLRPLRWARDVLQDLRYAERTLRRAPGFTAVAVVTLALGIGANSALFSVVSSVLLRPLPFPQPERLVRVWAFVPATNLRRPPALPDYRELRERNGTFAALGAYNPQSYNATGSDRPELLPAFRVTASIWSVLRIEPLHGELFADEAQQWGNHRVVVLSHDFWQRRYGADRRAIGRTLELDGEPFTIVGVMPPAFSFGGPGTQAWTPMAFAPGDAADSRNSYFIDLLGRLAPGITRDQAHADLSIIAADIDARLSKTGVGVALEGWQESMTGAIRPTLLLLLGGVGLVLLIACANLANLLLARMTAREQELTVRATLGAGRGRLARQLLTEHLLLAALGSAAGLLLAYALVRAIPLLGPVEIPRLGEVTVDGRVTLFAALLAVATGIAFGVWPARRAGRASVIGSLKQTARAVVGGRAPVRRVLITAEIAVSLVLLVGAALLMASLQRVLRVDPGFEPERLITARLNLPRAQTGARTRQFVQRAVDEVGALPGVRAAGITTTLPLGVGAWGRLLTLDDRPAPISFREVTMVHFRIITPDYFAAMGTPLRRGRQFNADDSAGAPLVAVVNETFARRYWPDGDPIGTQVSFTPPESLMPKGTPKSPRYTIVGVIADLRQFGLERNPEAEAFIPFNQAGTLTGSIHYLTARTTGDPMAAAAAIESAIHRIDRNVPVADVRPMESRLSDSVAQRRAIVLLLGGFAGLAVAIAVVGLYGVMAYMVGQRRTELGLRAAMGATAAQLARMVVADGMRMTLAGVAIGLVLAGGLSRVLAAQLFQVDAIDPRLYAAATTLFISVAVLACGVPAYRAVRVDAATVLRGE